MFRPAAILITLLAGIGQAAQAQVTNTLTTTDDAFLCTGPANDDSGANLTGLNFGAAGTLVVAPPASAKGEFQSVLKFNLAAAVTLFNSVYGLNHWVITGISLQLTSNYGTAGVQPNNPIFPAISGGQFVIEWLADDDWVEGTGTPNLPTTDGVTYDSLPMLLAEPRRILGTNTYSPAGINVPVAYPLPLAANLVTNISTGGDVALRLYAADNQIGYLFNSHNYGRGNEPLLNVVAGPLLQILGGVFTNGGFRVAGSGGTNSTYQIQASPDLSTPNWQTIGTATADGSGAIQFNDSTAMTQPQRFYRLSQ